VTFTRVFTGNSVPGIAHRRRKMAEVECEVDYIEIPNEHCGTQDGVSVTCGECGHVEESFGTGDRSVNRCLANMRKNCPQEQKNFYKADV
jgi:hypothetical protein